MCRMKVVIRGILAVAREFIAATDSAACTSYWAVAFAGAKGVVAALAVAAGFVFSLPAHADAYEVGIVTKGAFLLSEEPKVRRNGNLRHGLVGYLPIGTRVYVADTPRPVYNHRDGKNELYHPALSTIGIHGLLHKDLFVPVTSNPIAVVVSSDILTLYNPGSPTSKQLTKRLTIGRYGGYLEITQEHLAMARDGRARYIPAVLHRTETVNGLPQTEEVSFPWAYIQHKQVIVVEPQMFSEQVPLVPKWIDPVRLDSNVFAESIDRIKNELGEDFQRILTVLTSDDIKCLLKASTDAELSAKFWGNGIGLTLDLPFKQYDQTFKINQRDLLMEMAGETTRTPYLLFLNIKCNGGSPFRLQRLTLQRGKQIRERASVHLDDLANSHSQWILTLQGKEVSDRMVRIANRESYMQVLKLLDDLLRKGNSFIVELPGEEQDILLNFILREVSYFEHRTEHSG